MGLHAYVGSMIILFPEVGVGREPKRNQKQGRMPSRRPISAILVQIFVDLDNMGRILRDVPGDCPYGSLNVEKEIVESEQLSSNQSRLSIDIAGGLSRGVNVS